MVCLTSCVSNSMAKSWNSKRTIDHLNIPACDQYPSSALIDVVLLIAVVGACGFLLYPSASFIAHMTVELGEQVFDVVTEEIVRAPVLFGCLGLSILFVSMALVAIITMCTENRCGNSGCRGLSNSAEFDIQLETEEEKENSSSSEFDKGLFQLRPDRHKILEAKLKKIAPPNGRAVMVFKARCGCPVGRMEVPGPRKYRKVKN